MTPRERILATLRGERADRVPLVLSRFARQSRDELEAIAEPARRTIAERIYGQVHFEVAVPAHINRFLATPPQRIRSEAKTLPNGHRATHGVIHTPRGELTFDHDWDPETQTTWTIKYPCETLEDIEKIASIPWERPANLKPPAARDPAGGYLAGWKPAGGCLPEEFEARGVLATRISSPMVCVAGMMPFEYFLELSITERALIEELTERCRERILDVLAVLFSEPGIEYVWMGGSEWVTPPMASPALYDALVQEQERSIIGYIHEVSDAVVHIHCHGNVRHALGRTIERGADYTEPVEPPPDGDITLAEAKELAAGRITLGGNIEARVLCYESEETVEQAVRAAFEGGKERFVLAATEGPSPKIGDREFRNWMKMIDVWEELA